MYSGYDSIVILFLINFGVYDDIRLILYVIGVVFELWRDIFVDILVLKDFVDGFYFRVFVNGEVVINKMKFCGDLLFKDEFCFVRELILWFFDGEGFE